MNAEKPHFLSRPEVKNVYFFRNGDPYFQPRRLVINAKRVLTFDTLLQEVTGGVQASFGAVRNIYTPKGGHRVDSLEHLRSGEQYVAAGREKFKKIDYSQIGTRKKRTLQHNGLLKPVPQSHTIVSARFLKPIKEPCAIFVVANGDVLNPAVRFLIPNCVIGQFERILEMISEKMGLRIVGGVRSLYTFDGTLIMEGKKLENGQFYVAVGRDKFKRLPYSDLLFNKPIGMKRVNGSKAASLPPIYKYRRQKRDNQPRKSVVGGSEGGQDKTSPPAQSSKEQLSSFIREISQARLMTVRKKRSGLTASRSAQDDDDEEDRGGDDDKSSPEEGSGVQQEAEESSPDHEQKDNSQEHTTDIDGSSKTDTTEEPAHSEPAEIDQTIEESPFNREEEKKPEDENTEDDENKGLEEEEKIEDNEEIKDEGETSELEANDTENKEMEEEENKVDDEEIQEKGETSELEANDTNEEKQEEETEANREETWNEETAEESEEQQEEGEDEINEENEGNQTEETPNQTEEVSANTE